MNTVTTAAPTTTTQRAEPRKRSRKPSDAQTRAQAMAYAAASRVGPKQPQPKMTRKEFEACSAGHRNGSPRPGGLLAKYVTHNQSLPIFEDGLVYVSVEGHEPRRAVIGAAAFERITARDPNGPWLTRTRWWLDDEGQMRAYSQHEERPFSNGVLVAAAVLGAKDGETIEVPADPFDLRLSSLRIAE